MFYADAVYQESGLSHSDTRVNFESSICKMDARRNYADFASAQVTGKMEDKVLNPYLIISMNARLRVVPIMEGKRERKRHRAPTSRNLL